MTVTQNLRNQNESREVLVDVRLPPETEFDGQQINEAVTKKLRVSSAQICQVRLEGRSLDARRRSEIRWNCRVRTKLDDSGLALASIKSGRALSPKRKIRDDRDRAILHREVSVQRSGEAPRAVVVGSGPSGLFAAWLLAQHGHPPLVVERGKRIDERVRDVLGFERGAEHDPESNILFGEGGAGTFSDGKLTSRSKSPLVRLIYEIVVQCTGPKDVLIDAKPHVGTDRLRAVLVHLRRRLEKQGVEFAFQTRVVDVIRGDEGVKGVVLDDGRTLSTDTVLLGIGHSARDTYAMLRERGVPLEFKPFQTGLRIEHPQAMIDRAQFGEACDVLPPAEYILAGPKPRPTFSFCMCPGGWVVPSISESEHLCTNGMSRAKRDSPFANSGLVFTVEAEDLSQGSRGTVDPFAGIEWQRKIESLAYKMAGNSYRLPAKRVPDYLAGRPSDLSGAQTSYPLGLVDADIESLIPAVASASMKKALETFERRIPGFAGEEGILVGPETRGSSPVRIPRDPMTRESTGCPGLFPIGEGAGFAGGIVSAAIDGLYSALSVLQKSCQQKTSS